MSSQSTNADGEDLFPEVKTIVKVTLLDPFGSPITGAIEFLYPDAYGTFGAILEKHDWKSMRWTISNPDDSRVVYLLLIEAVGSD